MISIVQSYLSCRKQCCEMNGHLSTMEDISDGIPQESCLGLPLLSLC